MTITSFNGFHNVSDGGRQRSIRPEVYYSQEKKMEFNPYPITKGEEGVVERVSFRGTDLNLKIRVHDEILICKQTDRSGNGFRG